MTGKLKMIKNQVEMDSMQERKDKDIKEREINPRIQIRRVDFALQNIRDFRRLLPLPLGEGTGGASKRNGVNL